MDKPQATYAYNAMHRTLRQACKDSESLLVSQIEQYKLSSDEGNIFKQLIMNDGKYEITQHKNINNLKFRRQKIIARKTSKNTFFHPLKKNNNTNKKKSDKTCDKHIEIDKNYRWHKKLKTLSCIKKSTTKPLSVKRRNIAKQINDTVDLDGVSEDILHKLIIKTADSETDYTKLKKKYELKWIQKLKKIDIQSTIECKQGKKGKGGEITNTVNNIAFNINRWNGVYVECVSEFKKLTTDINNAMTKFGLATYNSEKKRFVPTLTKRQFNLEKGITESIDNGRTLYDFAMNMKQKFKTLRKKFEYVNDYVNKQISCQKYQNELKKMDQMTRAKKHKKRNNTKNDNKLIKKGLPTPKRDKPNQTGNKNKNTNSKPIQSNKMDKYFAKPKKKIVDIDTNHDNINENEENDSKLQDENDSKLQELVTNKKRKNSVELLNQPASKKRKTNQNKNVEKIKAYLTAECGTSLARVEKQKIMDSVKLNALELNESLLYLQDKEKLLFVHGSAIYML